MANELPLKLLVDTKNNKVLLAEASKEVVDYLFSLLALPIGTIVKLLSKDQMVGSIGELFSSLEQLEDSYLLSKEKKLMIHNPRIFSIPIMKNTFILPPDLVPIKPDLVPINNYYSCNFVSSYDYSESSCYNVTHVCGTICPTCGIPMSTQLNLVGSEKEKKKEERWESGFVKGVVTYSIMDDLSVVPMSTISSITLINKFQIKDLGSLKEKNVKLGIEEGLELLKASLQCKNALTTVFMGKTKQGM